MTDPAGRPASVAVERVMIRNFRSIEACDLRLGPLTYLVGPNGAGKSNFLDALRLVADALTTSLEQAVRVRGGFHEIRRRGAGSNGTVSVWLDLRLPAGTATYRLELESAERSSFRVSSETCLVPPTTAYYLSGGRLTSSTEPALPLPSSTRLYLVTAAGLPAFRPVFDVLSRMAFYNLDPFALRDVQPPDAGDVLSRDGRNAASVLARVEAETPDSKKIIEGYLSAIVPGLGAVERETVGSRESLKFEQRAANGRGISPKFPAQSMSDGTLRAFGVLLALFQSGAGVRDLSLVGIEEPEAAVHPAAAAVLREAISEASGSRQVIVTTHSPDLLDDPDLDPGSLLAVESVEGRTTISRLDAASLSALRDGLYTAGELLRVGQLLPAREPTQP